MVPSVQADESKEKRKWREGRREEEEEHPSVCLPLLQSRPQPGPTANNPHQRSKPLPSLLKS